MKLKLRKVYILQSGLMNITEAFQEVCIQAGPKRNDAVDQMVCLCLRPKDAKFIKRAVEAYRGK